LLADMEWCGLHVYVWGGGFFVCRCSIICKHVDYFIAIDSSLCYDIMYGDSLFDPMILVNYGYYDGYST
jgi:hypothetical protein